jgi:hypothetical protein
VLRSLDVIIGVIFLFALLSVICSALAEVLESSVRQRAKELEGGIQRLLADPNLATAFYAHPLIKALETPGGGKPSYIPSRSAVLALVEVLNLGARVRGDAATITGAASGSANEAAALVLASAEGDMAARLKALEAWFDSAMDRVSSLYKRRSQTVLLVLGALLVVVLNADVLNVVDALSVDAVLRDRLVTQASSLPDSARTGSGSAAYDQLQGTGLPIGWSAKAYSLDRRGYPEDPAGWVRKVLGLILTAFAISLGAPFWFDLMNRVVQLRASVKPADAERRRMQASGSSTH